MRDIRHFIRCLILGVLAASVSLATLACDDDDGVTLSEPYSPPGSSGRDAVGAADTVPTDDPATSDDAADTADDPDSGFDDMHPTDLVCATHSDCPCPEGVCVSTGECWCPPCQSDDDCWDELSCRSGHCSQTPVECIGPPRISPERGPTSGGTIVIVEGMEFYIGALQWWAQIGDGPGLRPIFVADLGLGSCALGLLTPPMPEGTYDVRVWYGGFPPSGDEPRGADPAGQFTYEAFDDVIGEPFCRSDDQCGDRLMACDLGMGRCVPDLCQSIACDGPCDPTEGCRPADETCLSDADCRMLESDCTCDAIGPGDDTAELSCLLGGCLSCDSHHCEDEFIEPACIAGLCTERRGDPAGEPCAQLDYSAIEGTLETSWWISGLDSATDGERVLLSWTSPTMAFYRNGVLGFALVDPTAPGEATAFELDDPAGLDSQAAVAWDGTQFGAIWLNERSPLSLVFQAFDDDGAPIGDSVVVDERMDVSIRPTLLAREGLSDDGRFEAFWALQDWSEEDGLYHAVLDGDGALVGNVDHLSWVVPSLESFAASFYGDHAVVAWPNSTTGREGLFAAHFPLGEAVVQRVAERGAGVALATTSDSYTLVWRDIDASFGIPLVMRTYDRDDTPLTEAVFVSDRNARTLAPRVTAIGGINLVSWLQETEQESVYQVMFRQVRDDGSPLAAPVEVGTTSRYDHFHQRVGDRVLVGWPVNGGAGNAIEFGTWECVRP